MLSCINQDIELACIEIMNIVLRQLVLVLNNVYTNRFIVGK